MIDKIALILSIIGGINWGSVGLFKFDIVAWICGGQSSLIARIIYTVVGLASVWCISLLFRESNDTVVDTEEIKKCGCLDFSGQPQNLYIAFCKIFHPVVFPYLEERDYTFEYLVGF